MDKSIRYWIDLLEAIAKEKSTPDKEEDLSEDDVEYQSREASQAAAKQRRAAAEVTVLQSR